MQFGVRLSFWWIFNCITCFSDACVIFFLHLLTHERYLLIVKQLCNSFMSALFQSVNVVLKHEGHKGNIEELAPFLTIANCI